jgi:hypothetical protein
MDTARQSLLEIVDYYSDLRARLGNVKFYDHLAGQLSKIASRPKPWTWRYVQGVQAGTVEPSPAFSRAVNALGAAIDDVPAILAYTVTVQVYARPGAVPPGAIVLAEARACAWPGCQVIFVPTVPNQKYCSKRLHLEAKRNG